VFAVIPINHVDSTQMNLASMGGLAQNSFHGGLQRIAGQQIGPPGVAGLAFSEFKVIGGNPVTSNVR
jgi:hypothetical protein